MSLTAADVPFDRLCAVCGLPRPVGEYQFALPGRRWAFDWAWPAARLALEIDGGGWLHRTTVDPVTRRNTTVRGHHHHPAGYAADCVKLNTALVMGWRVLRVTPEQLRDGTAVAFVEQALVAFGKVLT